MGGFRAGDQVEVQIEEDGFRGSYYEATVVAPMENRGYYIEYKTLLTDDQKRLLREDVDETDIRPVPPEIKVSCFAPLDIVDAFDNDGWWVGKITARGFY
ncbi:hypothetical protein GIB67_034384 [Kingdonia uniflora]|uniref:Agenet domain-containing protein n=1 Tax=Kingdonia uniflora TaxID=39325 RepID=A0A7J7NSN8_9MAGN|nr:hypothetical protein GIB67_034384 [Kingdonia uniflora]